jgi:hypothetical protein
VTFGIGMNDCRIFPDNRINTSFDNIVEKKTENWDKTEMPFGSLFS